MNPSDIIAVDTETTGPDFWHGCRPFITSICDGNNNLLFYTTVDPNNRDVDWEEEDTRTIQRYLNKAKTIVFHNATFDIRALEFVGIKMEHLWDKIEDTLLASHVICSGDTHKLKDLAIKYLRYWDDDETELQRKVAEVRDFAKRKGVDYARKGHPHWPGLSRSNIPYSKFDYWMAPAECLEYAAKDVERTWLLWRAFSKSIKQDKLEHVYYIRRQMIRIVYNMETRGVHFYKKEAAKQIDKWELEVEQIRFKISTTWQMQYVLDLNKPQHLADLFHNRAKIPVAMFTKTGKPSMNKAAVKYYESAYSNIELVRDRIDLPEEDIKKIVWTIKMYKRWKKMSVRLRFLKSYYAWSVDDRIHTRLNITGTRETRQSQSDPNLMNVEPELKKFFGPPEGYVWLMLDMVNIELRIWAYDVGNQELIELFESGVSVHFVVMETLYPEIFKQYQFAGDIFEDWNWTEETGNERAHTYKEMEPEIYNHFKTAYDDDHNFTWKDALKLHRFYRDVKAGNFGLIYGATEKKADETYGYKGATQKVFRRFPGIKEYFDECRREVYKNLYKWGVPAITPRGGYRLDVPLQEPYKAANYRTQGAAGWFMTLAMIATDSNKLYRKYNCAMVEQVHDSLTIEIPNVPELRMIVDSIIESIETSCLHLIKGTPVTYKIKEPTYV
jgi:DNA polymerase I-like protein with 3'-5' exonuclease and polymerase domains